MVKGIGKGIGGVFLKPPAGMLTLCPHTIAVSPCASYSDSIPSRSLGTHWVSFGWTSQKAPKVVREDSGAVYYGVSDSTRY